MSDRRRRYKEWEVVDVLIIQGKEQGFAILCYRCGKPLTSGKDSQREHLHELALDGKEQPDNCRYSHIDCHAIITDGTKATSAGSSKHRIAKTRRLEKKLIEDRNDKALLGFASRHLSGEFKERSVEHRAGKVTRKIKSRGFATNRGGDFKQTMRRGIVRRK